MTKTYFRIFDTQSEAGLKAAERFKARLENLGLAVTTRPEGFTRVRITGRDLKRAGFGFTYPNGRGEENL